MLKKQGQAGLYLLCGLPCSGKTTFAGRLAEEKEAVIFSLDQLVLTLFPEEDNFETHRKYVQRVEDTFFPIVQDLLCKGCSVVMDFPGHTKLERERMRQIAIQVGADNHLYHLQADLETVSNRAQRRNAELKNGEYFIPDWLLSMIIKKFEPPDDSENPIKIKLDW
ncbi:MAG: ATP-binding protein [Oscillatoriales cyanobacterium C42_A2020_001]|nr:ATP-binding protein [Leptolyngbyaceae cyanobacterium C42_A2020_001]